MRIDVVIKAMQKLKERGETDVIIGWWERDEYFEEIPKDSFQAVADYVHDEIDWSYTHEQIKQLVEEYAESQGNIKEDE